MRAAYRVLATNTLAGEFARYIASGLVALAVDFSLYVALTERAGWHYLVSATVAFCVGLATVYAFSVLWVFRHRRVGRGAHEFVVFALIGVVGLALTAAVLYILVDLAGLDYRLSKIVAAALVFCFNFGCRKYFLFTAARPAKVDRGSATL